MLRYLVIVKLPAKIQYWHLSLLVLIVLSHTASCGYRLLYHEIPQDVMKICILPLEEKSPNGIASHIHHFLYKRLQVSGLQLQADPRKAGLILSGNIDIQTSLGLASGGYRVGLFRLQASVHAQLLKTNQELLWQQLFEVNEEFVPDAYNDQPLWVETHRRTALYRLADSVAKELQERLLLSLIEEKGQPK